MDKVNETLGLWGRDSGYCKFHSINNKVVWKTKE